MGKELVEVSDTHRLSEWPTNDPVDTVDESPFCSENSEIEREEVSCL